MTGWLEGNVALITGGGSGLGRAVAERFLDEGASVVVADRDPVKLGELVEAAGDRGDRVHTVEADVRSTADQRRAVSEAVARFGKLDTLVPNAGIWDYQRSITRLDGESLSAAFDELFAINVKGYLLAVEASWRELVKTRGSVVMTLSNSAFYPNGGGPLYTASKHACRGLVLELAYELAPKVRVNGVAAGGMRTDLRGPESMGMAERSIEASFARSATTGDNPLLPLHDASVDPADFTAPYVLLASSANSSNITGAIIPVDGGIAARGFRTAAGGDDL
ncbi:3-(cis-5,6-dihydroxycyclohexa-1,3-dien-1-yl)propanoate dehydrogenase [Prescottella equi]|uniref:3-(cis-5,6-dihydroxycyclohexa-1, 3-dien-1-yl)propanoate dehydrogenase n=1 Tax=Rhodococcus hoagii TaxID=43767 RepID=UPI001DBEE1E4|nr:3-(cis-5,6-dihydroxycyclohexa-1,3-dien-1-yl)propanoate dehydrogenase [Prescottella equi]MBM4521050.1 3-(cis-5,6-dihydroxycyclohexa-1,3-dien-1-yl)propanoate dehydrogenase [Prescottella equi]MBM4529153.1 3-(cis-5,6-dihydroxycyclohexa-1,3-dien-1-yl)propanoate dehydrogenase [Prescottella equi]MBM4543698.1 3-(cis-5,6-dihydroxycyclohexa-1,3-dien-1-yl)propanoate dehydrogenase [Prescottella equi]MBM4571404.1 3-(cis-5,6-dihydroxycyclohexa-1,3-dien-1-yl)propanoate dehydrogenase [Prescottella equi]